MNKNTLIQVYIEKKFMLPYRIVMLAVALYFSWSVFNAFYTGSLVIKGDVVTVHHGSFYYALLRDIVVVVLFAWLGTGGARERPSDTENSNK